MGSTDQTALSAGETSRAGLRELRRAMFDVVVIALAVLSVPLALFATDDLVPATWAPPTTLLAGALAARWAVARSWSIASSILSAGLLLTIVGIAGSYSPLYVGAVVAIALMVSGVVLGRGYAIAQSGVLMALTLAPVGLPWAHAGSLRDPALAIIAGASTAVAWLICQPILICLEWSWHSYVQAEEKTRELQAQQGRLNRALKGLDDACYQLERANAELALARKTADEARRAKAELATTISHELRSPLNLIVSLSELLVLDLEKREDRWATADLRDDLAIIYRNAGQIANLIDDVLDLAQIDAQRMALERREVDLADLVSDVVAMVDGLFRRKGLSIRIDVPGGLPKVSADPNRIRQVLLNLLNNAARFTNEGGVTIRADDDGREVTVTVSDTGVGIAPADLPLVFEEFRQVGDAVGHRYGGSGFGLYLSKRVVELHGRTMAIQSREGEGTTFTFTLPTCGNVVSSPFPLGWDELTRVVLGRPRAVAVVGSPRATRVFQRYLDGYQVLAVPGDDAGSREVARHRPAALILADLSSAVDPWEAVGPTIGDVPIVRCPIVPDQPAGDEIAAYLPKPVTRESLLATIAQLGGGIRRLVVIDDDPVFAGLVERVLGSSGRGYAATTFGDGATALRAMRDDPPDAVLLDILMPGLDGYAVLGEMKADPRLRSIPVIVVSAFQSRPEQVIAEGVEIRRRDGLTVAEAMGVVKATLDHLLLRPASGA